MDGQEDQEKFCMTLEDMHTIQKLAEVSETIQKLRILYRSSPSFKARLDAALGSLL